MESFRAGGLHVIPHWPKWIGVFFKPILIEDTDLAFVYSGILALGFWEIRFYQRRRWVTLLSEKLLYRRKDG